MQQHLYTEKESKYIQKEADVLVQSCALCRRRTASRQSSAGRLLVCAGGLDILKFDKTQLVYSVPISIWELGTLFGGAMPTKAHPRGDRTVQMVMQRYFQVCTTVWQVLMSILKTYLLLQV